jgi:hypothetical protein
MKKPTLPAKSTKTFTIPVDLHADLKAVAKSRGMFLQYLIESFLRSAVTAYVTANAEAFMVGKKTKGLK